VVTHGGVIRAFALDALSMPESALACLDFAYASHTEFHLLAGRWSLAG
jgi:broad specificity phosphatase PhoE